MDINNYKLYSMLSDIGNQNENSLAKVLKLVEQLAKIKKITDAKEYIKTTWNLEENVTKYPIGANCVLSTKENEKHFCVNFEYEDENISYYYRK